MVMLETWNSKAFIHLFYFHRHHALDFIDNHFIFFFEKTNHLKFDTKLRKNQKYASSYTTRFTFHFTVLWFFKIIIISKYSFAIVWNVKDMSILSYLTWSKNVSKILPKSNEHLEFTIIFKNQSYLTLNNMLFLFWLWDVIQNL